METALLLRVCSCSRREGQAGAAATQRTRAKVVSPLFPCQLPLHAVLMADGSRFHPRGHLPQGVFGVKCKQKHVA